MNIRFHPEAKREFDAETRFYVRIEISLARQFVARIEEGILSIGRHPLAFPVVEDEVRRCLVKRFPFGLFYTVEQDEILLWAVMHLDREPGYWKERRIL